MPGMEIGQLDGDHADGPAEKSSRLLACTIDDQGSTCRNQHPEAGRAPWFGDLDEVMSRLGHEGTPARFPSIAGYEILEELGRGSVGVVYKARQLSLQRIVALKMLRAEVHASPDDLQRFLSEARVLAALKHPNIVELYDVDLRQQTPYFCMELVSGGTLADRMNGRPQPPRAAAQLLLTLARAIHVAHLNGIVHRDLKPSNVLLAPPGSSSHRVRRLSQELGFDTFDDVLGNPKITDFGIAKQLHESSGQTQTGAILGTPSYMAPEQAEGKSRNVGPAADIYGLGAILYEMLTGRPPFVAESHMETVLQLFHAEPLAPSRLQPKIPRDLETICLKCLQKDPRRRYASAEDLADDLQRFLANETILAKPPTPAEQLWKWTRRYPTLATLSACLIVACTVDAGLVLLHQRDLRTKLSEALANERGARHAEFTARERVRLSELQANANDLLHAGKFALETQDWHTAQLQLTRARDLVADEPELADLQSRIDALLRQTVAQQRDHQRWQTFWQLRNEALFHATLFSGSDLEAALQETRDTAWQALAQFGITPESSSKPSFDNLSYTDSQKAELVTGCYEVFVTLAEAVAHPRPDHPDRFKDVQDALALLDRAAQLGVTTHALHLHRARLYRILGDLDAAEIAQQAAEALPPSSSLDHFLLGRKHYGDAAHSSAIVEFQNVLQREPNHFWASYYLALCWLKTQRPDQAAACLTACLSQRRDVPWLYLLRGSAWSELNEFHRAEEDFATALTYSLPESARYGLLINRGVLRIRQGRYDDALDDLQQAIALRPQQYQGYVNLAQASVKAGRLPKALEQLDRAIQLAPQVAALYRTRAHLHLRRQDFAAALADFEQLVRLEGNSSRVLASDHFERGRLLHLQKDYLGALAAFDEALRLRPDDPQVCRVRAETLLELNRLPEALSALNDCLKFGPPDAGTLRARGAVRTRLGQYADAQTDYTRALELDPDAATYAARGWGYLVSDAPRLALADFQESLRHDPNQAVVLAGRGFAFARLGDVRNAIADADEASRREPESPRLCYHVARIYAQAVGPLGRLSPAARASAQLPTSHACQQRALQWLERALTQQIPVAANEFWTSVVEADQALDSIRQTSAFRQLAARYSTAQVSNLPQPNSPVE